jgi:hypothetical protein
MSTSGLPIPLPVGFSLADRYVIEATLSVSETGTAYRARDTALGEPVAIFVLAPAFCTHQGRGQFRWHFKSAFYSERGSVLEYGIALGTDYAVLRIDSVGPFVDGFQPSLGER